MESPPKLVLCVVPHGGSLSPVLGSRAVLPGLHWQGKVVAAGPEKKVGLEKEMLLKQFNEGMMK